LYGVVFIVLGNIGFFIGAGMGVLRLIFFPNKEFLEFIQSLLWYSALPVVLGSILILIDLVTNVRNKRKLKKLKNLPLSNNRITVVLTAYNDEDSIAMSIKDFIERPEVERVVVISNNSSDMTIQYAKEAGAIVHNEMNQGYGACVYRALVEGSKFEDTELICLCEGDQTFRAYDLQKFLAYIQHADIVNGTRIVEQLQESSNQLSMFMHYGNFAVAKLLEFKYLSDVTLSDVGTTYKLMRKKSLLKIISELNPSINLEFNPHLLEVAVKNNLSLLECPITFHPRVGKSKGGNRSNFAAFSLGLKMIFGILFGWKSIK
jgi:glycosyltransferase involved in cell wall biosynthesis